MKKGFFFTLFICWLHLVLPGCSKPTLEIDARVKTVRYACGPACDAVAFVLEADAMLYLPQSPLPESVRVDQLPVRVVFERTGNRAGQWEGPEGLEKVRVLQIRPR